MAANRRIVTGGVRGIALQRQMQRSAGGSGENRAQGWQGWFPPGTPMQTQAPKDVQGRAFDFPVGVNLDYTPRSEPGQNNVSFQLLRRLADPGQGGLDLLRLAIETVKNEMKRQRFKIVSRLDEEDDGGDRARAVEKLLIKPDGQTRWRSWLNGVLEDHLVIDAPSIYYRMDTVGGIRRPVFEQIDGTTVTLLLDNSGRTPKAPLPAYQQILQGLPAVEYTTEELGYYMDNPRPGRIYGMGPVEQICTIITIALNRQLVRAELLHGGQRTRHADRRAGDLEPESNLRISRLVGLGSVGATGRAPEGSLLPGRYEALRNEARHLEG
jgi:hypothetical protein